MSVAWMFLLLATAGGQAQVMELGKGPVATTTVAVKVHLDAEGRVLSCVAARGGGGGAACAGFPKGRVVSVPLRRDGRPVAGTMTVSTTTVVSAD